MSFKARLKIDGEDFRIIHSSYALQRDTDFSGRPSSDVRGGSVHFELESSENTMFIEWMCTPTALKDGVIDFHKRDSDAIMKTLEFKDAYLVSFTETFDNMGDSPMSISCVVSAREIIMGSASLENEWPS